MAASHPTPIRNSIAALIAAAVDAGSTFIGGQIQIAADSNFSSVLSTLVMQNPAFGAPVGGQVVANAIAHDAYAAETGTANFYRVLSRDGVEVFRGTVSGTGGAGDIQFSSTSIAIGDLVVITSFTYQSCP